ncbi:hypothetical protein C8R47DRAFT_1209082 [Mycena vitilis]|nr:hypothetical protein C8R47DRAFT_1209082 [Mycena vitilis]
MTTVSPTFDVHAYFLDNHHPLGNTPNLTYQFDFAKFRGMQVGHVLKKIQERHRSDCETGPCISCHTLGPIIAKSGWLLDDIPDATSGFDTTTSNARKQSMVSMNGIAPYLPHHQRDAGGIVILLLECRSMARTLPLPRESSRKRPVEDSTSDEANVEKKRKVPRPSPKGLCITNPAENPATTPIGLLAPKLPFPYWATYLGSLWFDKTRYISRIDKLLVDHAAGCIITGTSGLGKSAILAMQYAWYQKDCTFEDSTKMFSAPVKTDISREADVIKTDFDAKRITNAYFWGWRTRLCLVFDMALINLGGGTQQPIDAYLSHAIRQFSLRYKEWLGDLEASMLLPPIKMIQAIFKRAYKLRLRLFIGVDHWDAPILESLSYPDTSRNDIAVYLTQFINELTDPLARQRKISKLLIVGRLPLLEEMGITDISRHSDLKGALGMSEQEVRDIFCVLSHNRHPKTLQIAPNLKTRLGCYIEPSTGKAGPPIDVYNFSLVLNHVANEFDLDSAHRTLPDCPHLTWISQNCQHLLQYSGLHLGRQITMRAIPRVDLDSLVRCFHNDVDFRAVLLFLDAIQVVDYGTGPDPLWTVEMCSQSARRQLLSSCADIVSDESHWDIILRALLERDYVPLVKAISTRLFRRSLRTLFEMNEGGFQEMFDSFMEAHLETTATNPGRQFRDLTNNYFSQFGLLTNFERYLAMGIWNAATKPQISGTDAFGFLDILLVALRDIHPGRVVAIELKYISLFSLFRLGYPSKRACVAGVRGPGGKEFVQNCNDKLDELDRMSITNLGQVQYWLWNSDELKGSARSVQATWDDAVTQQQSYLDAIVQGNANNGGPSPQSAGITNAEKRVKANMNATNPVDQVVGFVICGIGRRIVTIPVEPSVQNTRYRYDTVEGWESVFEKSWKKK